MLIQVAQRGWVPAAVHDTVAAVARELVYRRNLRESIGQRIILWIGEGIGHLIRLVRHSAIARPLGFGFVALIVLLVVARLAIASRARDDGVGSGGQGRSRRGANEDPFVLAESLASEGRFEEAAHALCHGVLLSLARGERIKLDPARTSGDYARELRARGSAAHAPFRLFARRFDVAVFGYGSCDAELIADLRRLAAPFTSRARAA